MEHIHRVEQPDSMNQHQSRNIMLCWSIKESMKKYVKMYSECVSIIVGILLYDMFFLALKALPLNCMETRSDKMFFITLWLRSDQASQALKLDSTKL